MPVESLNKILSDAQVGMLVARALPFSPNCFRALRQAPFAWRDEQEVA